MRCIVVKRNHIYTPTGRSKNEIFFCFDLPVGQVLERAAAARRTAAGKTPVLTFA
jgi:hypothetical protein